MALVGRNGSIDWLGLPRFDSAGCFSALLGEPGHGRWLIVPIADAVSVIRHYRGDTMILETVVETETGAACVIDFLTRREGISDLVRIVRGLRGTVAMRTELIVRFEYGSVVPWVSRLGKGRREIIAGPDRLLLNFSVPLRGENFRTVGEFDISADKEVAFTPSWSRSYHPAPAALRVADALAEAENFRSDWSTRFKPTGQWSKAVMRSLLTLKALSHRETGGIVAAGTTSLPEKIGGSRNWDYRFCWGCATRRLPYLRCSVRGSSRRQKHGEGGFCVPSQAAPKTFRSCTASPASAVSWNSRCLGCQVMKSLHRFGSATPRPGNFSSMSTAKFSMNASDISKRQTRGHDVSNRP